MGQLHKLPEAKEGHIDYMDDEAMEEERELRKEGNVLDKPFIVSWKSGQDWHGKSIVMAATSIQAWEKFLLKWNTDFQIGNVDLDSNEVDQFEVEIAADEFLA